MECLTPNELLSLKNDWRFWARASQLPPEGDDWFVWMIMSGRGFGKTWTGSNYVIEFARQNPRYPIALIGQTVADVRDTMIETGESSILGQSPPDFMPHYEPSKRRLTWPNGATAITYSGDKPGQLRGPQHGLAWLDELAKMKYPQETWDMMEFGLRLGPRPHAIVTTTPRPIPIVRELLKDSGTRMVSGSTFDNAANLPARFLERLLDKYDGTRLGRQELYGAVLDDVPGALWTYELLDRYRTSDLPDMANFQRIGVAIDPAVSATEDSDETGIVVGGVLHNGTACVLEDLSGRYTPDEWGRRAVDAYERYNADFIIGEVNNGGDLVKHVIQTIDRRANFKPVRASRGKYRRAEPVAALYEQGKVHHVGTFADMEDQMCTWVPGDDTLPSPDRMDALVWLLTELMLGNRGPRRAQTKKVL